MLYMETMQGYVDKGFAECVSEHDLDDNNCWYLPHHAVSHPRKANKVRVVFDCAARYNGTSLNKQLLTGPDLLNNLFGVLTCFRKGKVTLVADIESMYHQVLVDPQDRKYLKFLRWPSGNTNLPPARYHMKVHVFGAASLPACATYALQQTAKDNDLLSPQDVIDTVLENFYMDDCLKSVDLEEEAIRMSDELSQLLKKGGFNLTKWLSNNDQVVSNFVLEKRAKVYLNLKEDKNILHQLLGVTLNFEEDSFQIDVNLKDKPLTRRGVLSHVSAVFDPLGFAAPVILKAKLILQELCQLKLGWDEPIPEQLAIRWSKWISNLTCLSELKVDRYFSDFEDADHIELHIFYDASQDGYGVVAYLRQSVQRDHLHKERILTGLNHVVFEGVLRVGGRLDDKDYHERVGHVGMSHTWATIRQRFWIVKGAANFRNVLGPTSRLTANKPYVTGVDYFGPIFVKQGRAMVKQWGCSKTVRAVHIQLAPSFSAHSFINALQRFFGRKDKELPNRNKFINSTG